CRALLVGDPAPRPGEPDHDRLLGTHDAATAAGAFFSFDPTATSSFDTMSGHVEVVWNRRPQDLTMEETREVIVLRKAILARAREYLKKHGRRAFSVPGSDE